MNVLPDEYIKESLIEFRKEKFTFIYDKDGLGHYIRKDGYDRVEMSDRISKLNGKYKFMADKIVL